MIGWEEAASMLAGELFNPVSGHQELQELPGLPVIRGLMMGERDMGSRAGYELEIGSSEAKQGLLRTSLAHLESVFSMS